ncbi:ATPase, T2SS/T4P/T4SS family [Phycisphaerales bacterium AB-hyl4]|uniref:ATPase, T2SS/T4P/T4SS family n=1 Tax=Natronomicrosphaera hydrolytica TaxID=3242702 RepID=A0ABV4U4V5_9BACT
MAHLEIDHEGDISRVALHEGQPKITIGRHPTNHVRVKDDRVSRFHCEVELTSDGVMVRDLGSSNGTRLNGTVIRQARLRSGHTFHVGSARVRVRFVDPDEATRLEVEHQQAAQPKPAPADDDRVDISELETADEGEAITSGEGITAGEDVSGSVIAGHHVDFINSEPAGGVDHFGGDTAARGRGKRGGKSFVAKQAPRPATTDSLLRQPEDDHVGPVMIGRNDFGGTLETLTTVGQNVPYQAADLSLINSRSEVVHAADSTNANTAQTIQLLRLLLLACIRTGASDVHLEPKPKGLLMRLRVDGGMVEAASIPADVGKRLQSLVKVLSDIDISDRSGVQEGHFSCKAPDRRVDYRVSYTPAMHGQKLVVRVLDPVSAPQLLNDIGLPPGMYRQIRDLSRQDTGMLLVCGPTGSGKTTTLYAVLRQIDAKQRNIVSIEDPIEYEIPGVTQIPVDAQRGQDFHALLRSVLRQDPDVIVLGEIRDRETATTAMQAATTGHLVLSTVHAKDTIGTVYRLLDLGVEPYLVASTLNLVLAQRLARQLCPECKQPYTPPPSQSMRLGRRVDGVGTIYKPAGCKRCFNTGYSGRYGVFELLNANDDIRDVILNNGGMAAMKKAVEMSMYTPLREAGMQMVIQGNTAIEEIDRIIGM